jgi:hypothetical protein
VTVPVLALALSLAHDCATERRRERRGTQRARRRHPRRRRGETHCSLGTRRPGPPQTGSTPATWPGTARRTTGCTARRQQSSGAPSAGSHVTRVDCCLPAPHAHRFRQRVQVHVVEAEEVVAREAPDGRHACWTAPALALRAAAVHAAAYRRRDALPPQLPGTQARLRLLQRWRARTESALASRGVHLLRQKTLRPRQRASGTSVRVRVAQELARRERLRRGAAQLICLPLAARAHSHGARRRAARCAVGCAAACASWPPRCGRGGRWRWR